MSIEEFEKTNTKLFRAAVNKVVIQMMIANISTGGERIGKKKRLEEKNEI